MLRKEENFFSCGRRKTPVEKSGPIKKIEEQWVHEGVMASSDKGYADPFDVIHEPFSSLSEMDFELHDIYMDHEPDEEFVSSLDKCKDIFLNALLSDENLRNSCMADEIRAQVYHATDWQSDEDEHEVLKNNYRIHDPTIKWDKMVTGYGCVHAIATINYIHQMSDEYIDDMFSKEQFLKCYSANISPVNGSNLWPQTEFINPLPPMSRRMPDRPKVNRRRHVSENDRRVHTPRTVRYGNCFEYVHNHKGCGNSTRELVPMPPNKRGRPRKEQCEPSQASCDRSKRQEPVPMPPKKKGGPRKKVQSNPNQASSSKSVKRKKKTGRGFEEQMKDLFDKEDIDDDSVVDMLCTFEAAISQPKHNNEKGDGFQDAMDYILQGILHGNDEKCVEDVETSMTKTLNEVGDAMV
ncbi:unnamed protein product [Lactuca virosa]|uniref:Uncharacterized protein n=1 Tax=Lactuca virosa TaxID=75947 RepID=A0AAU9LXL8_9ASTR|nr:unnamed protein product [Lactuca virosa]